MGDPTLHQSVSRLLQEHNRRGGYSFTLLCTEQGLPLASDGEGPDPEVLSAVASLFDEVVLRAVRDLDLRAVEELTLLDPRRGRMVVRPLKTGETRLFLVVVMSPRLPWRKNLHTLCAELETWLARLDPDAPWRSR